MTDAKPPTLPSAPAAPARLKSTEPKVGLLSRMSGLRGVLALVAVLLLWIAYPPFKGGSRESSVVPFKWVADHFTTDRDVYETVVKPWELEQLRAVLLEGCITGLLAVGMTLVIIGGGIDLSVGSMLGMCGVFFAIFSLRMELPMYVAVPATLLIGALFGMVNGFWVVNLRIGLPLVAALGLPLIGLGKGWPMLPTVGAGLGIGVVVYLAHRYLRLGRTMQPFAATLAMMVVARGTAKLFSGGAKIQTVVPPDFYDWMSLGFMCDWLGVKIPSLLIFVFLGTVLVAWLLMRFSRFGRHVYAIGGNAEAARLSGVKVLMVTAMTYVICGVTAAMAGIGQVCRLTLGDPQEGVGYELSAIAAVVLGGTSLMGGRGSVLMTLLGVLIIGFLDKFLSLHNPGTWAILMAKGGIIVFAIAMQKQSK